MSKERRYELLTTTVDPEHVKAFNSLSRETDVPRAALIRNALSMYLRFIAKQRPGKIRLRDD